MGANVNHRCRNGETAVFVACSKGLLACVRALVDAGADVGIARHVSRPRVLSCPRWILVRPSCHCRRARDVRRRCCAVCRTRPRLAPSPTRTTTVTSSRTWTAYRRVDRNWASRGYQWCTYIAVVSAGGSRYCVDACVCVCGGRSVTVAVCVCLRPQASVCVYTCACACACFMVDNRWSYMYNGSVSVCVCRRPL